MSMTLQVENYEAQMSMLQDSYGLSFQAACDIMEVVAAFNRYIEKCPQATKDALGTICELFDVGMVFHQRRGGALALTGIFNQNQCNFLYRDAKEVRKWIEKSEECYTRGGDYTLRTPEIGVMIPMDKFIKATRSYRKARKWLSDTFFVLCDNNVAVRVAVKLYGIDIQRLFLGQSPINYAYGGEFGSVTKFNQYLISTINKIAEEQASA